MERPAETGPVDRFRLLADAMPQLVWTATSDGVVDYYNARVSDYGGWTSADGQYEWQPLVHPEDLEATLDAWSAASENGEPYECEHRILMADGSYRWHLSRAVPMAGGDEAGVRWFGTATDVHLQKEAEQRFASMAHTLQASLLPRRLPQADGFVLGSRYRPAIVGTEVGGDWYDALHMGSVLTLVIGDVTGHGVTAAAVMGAARHAVAVAVLTGRTPSEALVLADRYLTASGDGLVTCLVAHVDLVRGHVAVASAGHPPPVLRTRDGATCLLDADPGPPLGFGADRFDERVWALDGRRSPERDVEGPGRRGPAARGATLVLYTDGLLEQRGEDIDERLELLVGTVAARGGGPVDALCDELVGLAPAADDDLAVLVAQVL